MRVKLKDYTQTKIISYNTKKKNNLDKKKIQMLQLIQQI